MKPWSKTEAAGVILGKHLAVQPEDSMLNKCSPKELKELIVLGMEYAYSYTGRTNPPEDIVVSKSTQEIWP